MCIRDRCGKGHRTPCPLQAHCSPSTSLWSATWKLTKPCTLGFLMETSLCRHDPLLTPLLPSPLLPFSPSCRMESGAESSKLLIMARSSGGQLHLGAFQQPIKSYLLRSKPEKGIQELCVGTRVKGLLISLIKLQGF